MKGICQNLLNCQIK